MSVQQEPQTVEEWKTAYFRMMDLHDAAQAALAQAERERDHARECSQNDFRIRKATEQELLEARAEVERLEQQIIETSIRRAVAPAAEQADHMWANQSYVEENAELRAEVERLKEEMTYPDDPARSVAAMLSRMSRKDKQAFNFCVKQVEGSLRADLARVRGALEAALRDFEHELARDYMDRATIINNVPIPLNMSILRLWDRARAALEDRG